MDRVKPAVLIKVAPATAFVGGTHMVMVIESGTYGSLGWRHVCMDKAEANALALLLLDDEYRNAILHHVRPS